jgi:hypothetical protein
MALYVRWGVQITRRDGKPVASGGKPFVRLNRRRVPTEQNRRNVEVTPICGSA